MKAYQVHSFLNIAISQPDPSTMRMYRRIIHVNHTVLIFGMIIAKTRADERVQHFF
jgi:hypothetical protein